ncbi:MAG: DUF192 domain-containing protein [Stellaceae bacterium]
MIGSLWQPTDAGFASQVGTGRKIERSAITVSANYPIGAPSISQLLSKGIPELATIFTRRALFLLSFLISVGTLVGATDARCQSYPTASLTIVSASGPHSFKVELAETPAQMEQGLMFRQELAPDAGMLFDFKQPTMATMWMRNTLIPLDMLFVDARGRIVNIHERAVPQSDAIIAAAAPVRAVIELNGGTAARLGIKPGDRVIYPIFTEGS